MAVTDSNADINVRAAGEAVCMTFTVPEAGAMVGLNRNAAYAAAKRGEIPTISFGKLLRVPKAAWLRMLAMDVA
jgi:hypothetical protein